MALSPILDLLGQSSETWEDRLRRGTYVSPSGTRHSLQFMEVSRSFRLRGTAFEFSGVNDAYVQQRGVGPRLYPWQVLFFGPDHDRQALAFEASLIEPGVGRLEHPLYGSVPKVVPLGEVTRRESPSEQGGMSSVEVTFYSTTGTVYPRSAPNSVTEIEAALAGFGRAMDAGFGAAVNVSRVGARVTLLQQAQDFLNKIEGAMSGVTTEVTGARANFNEAMSQVRGGLEVVVGSPLALAQQVRATIMAPGLALASVGSLLESYAVLAGNIFSSQPGDPESALQIGASLKTRVEKIVNGLHLADLVASTSVAGSISAANRASFSSRGDAVLVAAALQAQFESLSDWRENAFSALSAAPTRDGQLDTGGAFQALQSAAALAAGKLISESFELAPGRRVVLSRARTIIDLSAELYGSVSPATLDYMIRVNDLNGDEILELPKGKSVLYYPRVN